jgi:hypothetical protein
VKECDKAITKLVFPFSTMVEISSMARTLCYPGSSFADIDELFAKQYTVNYWREPSIRNFGVLK